MSANQTSKPILFQASGQGQPMAMIDVNHVSNTKLACERESYSAQEMQFLKYLASKGHTGGTA